MTLQPVSAITEPLKVVRRRAQPKAVLVARLTATATASYLIALLVPGTSARPTLPASQACCAKFIRAE